MIKEVTIKNIFDETVTIRIGTWVPFKSDIEQTGKVVKIERGCNGYEFTVVPGPDGFSGAYIGRCDSTVLYEDDIC